MVFVLIGLVITTVFAEVEKRSYVTITPEKPHFGDTLVITYDTNHPEAFFNNPKEITASLYWEYEDFVKFPVGELRDMKEEDGIWRTEVVLSDSAWTFVPISFFSEGLQDDNDLDWWPFYIHGSDGLPVRNAHGSKGMSMFLRYGFDSGAEIFHMMIKELKKEIELYPENLSARVQLASMMASVGEEVDSLKLSLEKALRDSYPDGPQTEKEYDQFITVYKVFGDSIRVEELKEERDTKYPQNSAIMKQRWEEVEDTSDKEKQRELVEKYLEDFPDGNRLSTAYLMLFDFYCLQGDSAMMLAYGTKWIEHESTYKSYALSTVADSFVVRGVNVDMAIDLLEQAIERVEHEPLASKRMDLVLNKAERAEEISIWRSGYYSVLAKAYRLKGDSTTAASMLRKAIADDMANKSLYPQLAEIYQALEETDSLKVLYQRMIARWPEDDDIEAAYLTLLDESLDSEDVVGEEKNSLRGEYLKVLHDSSMHRPAPEFSLVDLDGEPVEILDPSFDVLVLEFSTTWCGGCKAVRDVFQAISEEYDGDPRIRFHIVNTSWGRNETLDYVRKYFEKHGLTVPIAYDPRGLTTRRFGIVSVPSFFILDGDGIIRYKLSYYGSEERFRSEIKARVEALRP